MMYELSRNRFKELKHFCLQYPEMKERMLELYSKGYEETYDPTGKIASELADIKKAMNLIEMTAFNVGKFPGEKILKIVTENCCVSEVCPDDNDICEWYLRKFYWMLSQVKGVI